MLVHARFRLAKISAAEITNKSNKVNGVAGVIRYRGKTIFLKIEKGSDIPRDNQICLFIGI